MPRQSITAFLEGRKLIALPPHASVRHAAEVMADERLVGMFSERDLMVRIVAKGLDPATTTLDQVMTKDPQTIAGEDTLHDALVIMQARGFRHLPVMSGKQVRGMLSLRDIPLDVVALRQSFQAMRAWRPPEDPSDPEKPSAERGVGIR